MLIPADDGIRHARHAHHHLDIVDAHDVGAAIDADGDRGCRAFQRAGRAAGRGCNR